MTARRAMSLLLGGVLLVLLLLAVALSGLLVWVLDSEPGTAWSLRQLQRYVPAVTVEDATGSWRQGVAVAALRYDADGLQVELEQLDLAIDPRLWTRRVTIERLHAARVAIRQQPAAAPEPEPSAERIELPALSLPLRIALASLRIDEISYQREATQLVIGPLTGALALAGDRLRWQELALTWEGRRLATSGWLHLRDDYPLQADAHLSDPALGASAGVALSGDLAGLQLHLETAGPAAALVEAELDALDPLLPFRVQAQLTERLVVGDAETGATTVEAVDLRLEGNLDAATGRVAAHLVAAGYDAVAVALPLQWEAPMLTFQPQLELQLDAQDGRVRDGGAVALDCRLQAEAPFPLACSGELAAIALAPWLREGSLSSALQFRVDSWQPLALTATLPDLTGTLAGETIRGAVAVAGDGQRWAIDELLLAIGDNRLRVDGTLGARSELTVALRGPQLAQLHPELGGTASLDATVSGPLATPLIELRGDARALRWQQSRLGSLALAGKIDALGAAPSTLTVAARELAQGEQRVAAVDLAVDGSRDRHTITLEATDIAGQGDVRLGCAGASDADLTRYDLSCARGELQLALAEAPWLWRFAQPLRLGWQRDSGAVAVQPFCLASDDGELCLTAPLRWRDGNLSGALALRDLALDPFVDTRNAPLQLVDRPTANASIELASLTPLRLQGRAEVGATAWRWATPDGVENGELGPVALTVDANDRRALLTLATGGPSLGTLTADVAISDPTGNRNLTGRISLDALELAPLGWIAPELQIDGELQALVTLGGSLAAPTLAGRIELRDGQLLPPAIGQPVENIALGIDFDLDRATLDGRFMLAPGAGRITGTVDLPAPDRPWQVALALAGDHLQIQPLAGSLIQFAPRMTLTATPERIDVAGRLDVEKADIRLKALPPDTADVSPDVEWADAEAATQAPLQLHADVALNLGQQTRFEGFGAELQLSGALRARHTPERGLRLQGQVQVPEGRYRAYGQRLLVRRGTALFTGAPGNPELNLEAIREMPPTVRDQVVGIRVIGPLQNPTAQLFAEPSMPESDIAYFLLTGRMPPEDGSGEQISAAGALLSLGLAGTGDQTEQLAERFGITDFQISTRETEMGTEATVSGYLTPRLYVRYGTGLRERINSITFQYRLTPKLVLEAISGAEEALDLLYSFTID